MRDRNVLLRLLICAVAIVALTCAVEGWRAPFPYRIGQISHHGISAKVTFKRENKSETIRLRNEREEQIPYTFNHDPAPLGTLGPLLKKDLLDIAAANRVTQLSGELRRSFGLTSNSRENGTDESANESDDQTQFEDLQTRLATTDGTEAEQIEHIVTEFNRFIAPLKEHGLADKKALKSINMDEDAIIRVVTVDVPAPETAVSQAEVVIDELFNEAGLLGSAWDQYPKLNEFRSEIETWLLAQSARAVTLTYDSETTQKERKAARDSVAPVVQTFDQDDLLVRPGETIDEELLAILRAEYEAVEANVPFNSRLLRVTTVMLMFVILIALNGYFLVRNEPVLIRSLSRLGIFFITITVAVFLCRLFSVDPWRAEVIPLVATVMVLAIAYNQVMATVTAFTLTIVVTVSTVDTIGQFIVLMSVCAAAVIPLQSVSSRSTLIKAGFWTGLIYLVVFWGAGVIHSQSVSEAWSNGTLLSRAFQGAGWCLVTGYLVAGSLPFIESSFGVVTDISLLEMSDVSHPLLQELVRRAPGTYNHSITVATIGESAAESIGANGLMVRVGAYFHDIGKMLKPQYFIENHVEGMESRHDHLAPAMSTLIIIGHVKDGADLARQHHLPTPIINFIEQHHGTTLVEYFYHEATKQADQQPEEHKTRVEESSFRYPGPKPQTREAGVMMLADSVESASRTLSDPTPKRIETLVHDLTLKKLLDGQFDDCALTLKEIHRVEKSLTKSLIGIYHGRIKYPEQRTA